MHLSKSESSSCFKVRIFSAYRVSADWNFYRQETEITAIRERLDHIHGLLSLRAAQSRLPGNSTELQTAQLSEYPWDESIISRNWRREFPFMTIQTPSMMCLLGLDSRLAAQLVVLERTEVATMIKPVTTLDFVIEYHNAIE